MKGEKINENYSQIKVSEKERRKQAGKGVRSRISRLRE
jgi:hypothetical protein